MTKALADSSAGLEAEAASWRDREARVFYRDGGVYRALSARALAEWRALTQTDFIKQAMADGQVVETREVTDEVGQDFAPRDEYEALEWAGILEHQRVPLVSYPNEWSFSMLRDAALLQLDLLTGALGEGFVLKDSSAYNIQWIGTRPVFIDLPSFARLEAGEPWVGYQQFCQQYLYPLMLTAYKDIPFQPWLRASLDGIPPAEMSALFGGLERLKKGVFTHVYLQAKLTSMTASKPQAVRREARELGFSRDLIVNNARGLRKLIAALEWKSAGTEWGDYDAADGSGHNYSSADHRAKEQFVEDAARSQRWPVVWDLGANTGRFTRIAARHAERAVAMDIDPLAIDRLYNVLRGQAGGEGEGEAAKILPLVNDLVDPSPARGWRGRERSALLERESPDLILALALVHHIVIGRNVPMVEFIDWLASYGAAVVIEFPTRSDSMVKRLLINRDDHFADYEQDFFERCLRRRFDIVREQAQESGGRVLYFARPRA